MDFKTFVFYFLAAVAVIAALRVVTARNPVHAALFLVLTFFSVSGIWLLLGAEFLAITLVLVYVGAVMVLFLFVVMMLDINIERLRQGFLGNLVLGVPIALLMMSEMVLVLAAKYFGTGAMPEPAELSGSAAANYSNTKEIGRLLYTEYMYPSEITSIILLVSLIVAVMLTLRQRKDKRGLKPSDQVAVKREDRIRMVSMRPESELTEPIVTPETPAPLEKE